MFESRTPAQASVVVFVVLLLLLSGCGGGSNIHRYSQAQLTALTTREVEANFNETYRAATEALFDSGYTIDESDHEGGIITGIKGKDQTQTNPGMLAE